MAQLLKYIKVSDGGDVQHDVNSWGKVKWHHPVSRMPCLSPSSKFSTNSMPFLSTSFKFSTKAVSWVRFLEAILLVNLLEHGLLFQACLNQSSCLWKEVEQFKGASNAYVYIYIYIYVIGSHSSSSKNIISQLFGLWMKTTTLVLGELLKGQIYVPSGSLVRHNMTSSEFKVLATVSLATWLRVCRNSSFSEPWTKLSSRHSQ